MSAQQSILEYMINKKKYENSLCLEPKNFLVSTIINKCDKRDVNIENDLFGMKKFLSNCDCIKKTEKK
jgi:hypothetical protein